MIPRLQEKYQGEIRTKLQGLDKYENIHQVPKIEKIIVHMGVSPQLGKDVLEDAIKVMTTITGRKPVLNKAKVSVANFKLRQGMNTGCRVTLRRQGMYEFLDRLVAAAIPRIRDFRGINSKGFDGLGNYSLGVMTRRSSRRSTSTRSSGRRAWTSPLSPRRQMMTMRTSY